MRSLMWILLGFLLTVGFGTMVTAEEGSEDMESEPDGGVADGGVADGGDMDGGDSTLEPPPPPPPEKIAVDERPLPSEAPKFVPFTKGSMELTLGLSLSGNGTENYLGVAGRYGYYVMDNLAAGLDLRYTHIFVDKDAGYDFPDSMTLLPYLKYVLSKKAVAPYVLAAGGYEVEWGAKNATNAWILGLGGGVHVSVSKRVRINIELLALHYWYNKNKTYWYEDDSLLRIDGDGGLKVFKDDCKQSGSCGPLKDRQVGKEDIVLLDTEGNKYLCTDEDLCRNDAFKDKKDRKREWFFPLISIGVGVSF